VDGRPVSEEEVTGFIMAHQAIIAEMKPSFFEMTVAMAFEHFAAEKVDVAIVETGMGGRLDSTNILSPVLSVITNISEDHTEFLGLTHKAIAMEKGGIIKEGVPLVVGPTSTESEEVLLGIASERSSQAFLAREEYQPQFQTLQEDGAALCRIVEQATGKPETWPCGLSGSYQMENLSTALCAISRLREQGWELSGDMIREGLARVVENTGILGRWQTVGSDPRSICDTAHNPTGIQAVMEQLDQVSRKQLHMVWGMVSDKEPGRILPLLPRDARYYFTPSSVPRSMDAGMLREKATAYGLEGKAYASVQEAYRAAKEKAGIHDLIFTGGSTFVVADLLQSLGFVLSGK
jgi:dihydrofolate synthase/folylpolyglutamate synthase